MNSLSLLVSVVTTLRRAGLDTWVCGGWAEELRHKRKPGSHKDIDLVLRAPSFGELDDYLRERMDLAPVDAKKLPHKRAVVWEGVLVELVHVDLSTPSRTSFFDGRFVLEWPEDTFTEELAGCPVPVVSSLALDVYRKHHALIVNARDTHLAALSPSKPHRTQHERDGER